MKSLLGWLIVVSPVMFVCAVEGIPTNHMVDLFAFTCYSLGWALPFVILLIIRTFYTRMTPLHRPSRSLYFAEVISSVLTLLLMVYPLTLSARNGDFGDALLVIMFPVITVPFALFIFFLSWGAGVLISRFRSKAGRTPNLSAHTTA